MYRLRPSIAALALATVMATSPALADNHRPDPNMQERAEKALKEGIENVMRALELIIGTVPQYEMPKVLENGDIIIRRKNPRPPPKKEEKRRKRGDEDTT